MSEIISVRINVSRIEKARLYAGKNGKYLDILLMKKREVDQYGNDWMVVQSVSKEERQQGVKGPILGDAKTLGLGEPAKPKKVEGEAEEESGVPF